VEDPNLPQHHLLANDVNMLRASVVDWVCCHVDNAHIVTLDNCGLVEWNMELLKKLANPVALVDCMSNHRVLDLSTRPRHHDNDTLRTKTPNGRQGRRRSRK
jgi:hypothetical protein